MPPSILASSTISSQINNYCSQALFIFCRGSNNCRDSSTIVTNIKLSSLSTILSSRHTERCNIVLSVK